MDSSRHIVNKEPEVINQTVLTEIDECDNSYYIPQYQDEEYGQEAAQIPQELFDGFDFEGYVEEVLARAANTCEDKLEAEKAREVERFLKEAYDNLLNMKCPPSAIVSEEEAEEQRKATEKFLQDSYNNLLHMFDDDDDDSASQTGKG